MTNIGAVRRILYKQFHRNECRKMAKSLIPDYKLYGSHKQITGSLYVVYWSLIVVYRFRVSYTPLTALLLASYRCLIGQLVGRQFLGCSEHKNESISCSKKPIRVD